MSGLYAHRQLQAAINGLGPVDRFPQIGISGAETHLTLAIGTAMTGHVQVHMCLDLVAPDGHVMHSTPMAAYPLAAQDVAYSDALLVSNRYRLTLRRADPKDGWKYDLVDGGPGGDVPPELQIGG